MGGELAVVDGLADEFLFHQVGVALELGFGETIFGANGCELRLRRFGGQLQILRVELRQGLALCHPCTGINQSRDNFSGNAKTKLRFVARAHFARINVLPQPRTQNHLVQ